MKQCIKCGEPIFVNRSGTVNPAMSNGCAHKTFEAFFSEPHKQAETVTSANVGVDWGKTADIVTEQRESFVSRFIRRLDSVKGLY